MTNDKDDPCANQWQGSIDNSHFIFKDGSSLADFLGSKLIQRMTGLVTGVWRQRGSAWLGLAGEDSTGETGGNNDNKSQEHHPIWQRGGRGDNQMNTQFIWTKGYLE